MSRAATRQSTPAARPAPIECSPGLLGRRTRPQTLGMTGTDQLERLPHRGVAPLPRQQLVVGPGLLDPAGVQDDDPVGGPGRLQPVGDDDRGPPARHPRMAAATRASVGQVEVRRRLVEQQDGRVDQLGAGQRDQLALAGRQRPAPLGQLVVVAARQARR